MSPKTQIVRLSSLLAASLLLCGCDTSLEVRGTVDRIIGERVTFELKEGESTFSGDVELIANDNVSFDAGTLKANQASERELSFVIPADIATGRAVARLGREGDDSVYEVSLQINRLAVALNGEGSVETLPLGSTTLEPALLRDLPGTVKLMALSQSGGEVAVVTETQVDLLPLGKPAQARSSAIEQPGVKAMAAVPDGIIVCTDTALIRLSYAGGQTSQTALPFNGCQALDADAAGTRAVVVGSCNPGGPLLAGDCITLFSLAESITQVRQDQLDDTADATLISIQADGLGAVVADAQSLHGIWLEQDPPKITSLPWKNPTQPVAMDSGPSSLGALFAVADANGSQVTFWAFNPTQENALWEVDSKVTLPEAPTAMAYGRRSNLYIATGASVYKVLAEKHEATPQLESVSPTNPVVSLAVQP